MEGIVERAQVWEDFFAEVARQEAEGFAGFDGRAGEDDAIDFFLFEGGDGGGDGEEGLAGAGGADAEGDLVFLDRLDVGLLPRGAGDDRRLARRALDAGIDQAREGLGGGAAGGGLERLEEFMALDRHAPAAGGLELVEDLARAVEGAFFALDADPAVARGGAHAEASLKVVEEARVVRVEGLGGAGVLELEGDGIHRGRRGVTSPCRRKRGPSRCVPRGISTR